MEEKQILVTVSTKLTPQMKAELEDYCWVRRLKKAEVIRTAISEYMARAKEREINLV